MRNGVARMPFEITNEGDHFLVRLYGTITAEDLTRLANEGAVIEDSVLPVMNRIVDLTGVEEFAIGFPEMFSFAFQRRSRPFSTHFKSALIACEPVQVGYARMFQTLNTNPMMEIRILDSVQDARDWFRRESVGSDASATP